MNVIAALICAAWWLLALLLLRNLRNVRLLSELPVPERDDWPDVAVIMPARNEAATLDAGVRSRLGDEYPGLKLVLVNDRSDDDTGAVADTIAAEDPRLTVIHNSELPAGWLGKVHALQVGVQSTDTPWILFSDVDVHVGPHAMRAVVHYAESEGFDVVAVLPTITSHTLLTHALQALFLRILWAVFDVKALQNPKSKFGIGVGAFTLVRRTALEASPGLSAIRMEVADDLMLGRTLKASGARCSGLNGAGATSVDIRPPRARLRAWGREERVGRVGELQPAPGSRFGGRLRPLRVRPLAGPGPGRRPDAARLRGRDLRSGPGRLGRRAGGQRPTGLARAPLPPGLGALSVGDVARHPDRLRPRRPPVAGQLLHQRGLP